MPALRAINLVSLVLVGRCGLELHVCLLTLCEVYCGKSMLKTCYNFSMVEKFPDNLSTSDRS